jgi:hypothetical protein
MDASSRESRERLSDGRDPCGLPEQNEHVTSAVVQLSADCVPERIVSRACCHDHLVDRFAHMSCVCGVRLLDGTHPVEEPIDHGTQPESRIIERQGCARDDEHEHSQVPKDIDPEEVVAFPP